MSLTRSSLRGVMWLLLQNVSGRAAGLVSQIVLAGLLQPSDFGVVGLAYSVTTLIGTLAGFGIEDVLLSRQRRLRFWVGPALWLNLVLALVGTLLMVGTAPLAAIIYKSTSVGRLIYILAVAVPFTSLSVVPSVIIQAQLKFRFLAIYATSELVAIQLTTIVLALFGFGAYSFVIPVPVAAAIKAIVYWHLAGAQFQWRVRLVLWRYLLSAGFLVFGQRLLTDARNNADRILLGVLADPTVVGLYFFASKLAAVPIYTLASSLGRVLLPTLARLRKEPARQFTATLSASRILAMVVLPLSFLQALLARPALHFLFAEKWMGAVPLVEILSVALAFDVLPTVAGTLASANGRFSFQLGWSLLSVPVFVLLVGVGGTFGSAQGVACAVAAFYIFGAPAYSYSALRPFGCSLTTVLGSYGIPILCSLFAIGPAAAFFALSHFHESDIIEILGIVTWTCLTYPLIVRLAGPETFREMRTRLAMGFFAGP